MSPPSQRDDRVSAPHALEVTQRLGLVSVTHMHNHQDGRAPPQRVGVDRRLRRADRLAKAVYARQHAGPRELAALASAAGPHLLAVPEPVEAIGFDAASAWCGSGAEGAAANLRAIGESLTEAPGRLEGGDLSREAGGVLGPRRQGMPAPHDTSTYSPVLLGNRDGTAHCWAQRLGVKL
jgi:hypothetical protein